MTLQITWLPILMISCINNWQSHPPTIAFCPSCCVDPHGFQYDWRLMQVKLQNGCFLDPSLMQRQRCEDVTWLEVTLSFSTDVITYLWTSIYWDPCVRMDNVGGIEFCRFLSLMWYCCDCYILHTANIYIRARPKLNIQTVW